MTTELAAVPTMPASHKILQYQISNHDGKGGVKKATVTHDYLRRAISDATGSPQPEDFYKQREWDRLGFKILCVYGLDKPHEDGQWSQAENDARFRAPPAIGTRVKVTIHGTLGTVVGYFIEHEWTGVIVHLDQDPLRREPNDTFAGHALVFGTEIKKIPQAVLNTSEPAANIETA